MVSSTTRKIFSLAISLLVVVISLTGVALGATAPSVTPLTRYYPGFSGAPGKMVRDAANNFYVTDFWGKGIMKLDRRGNKLGFIATKGRPTAVAVMPDSRLVVAMAAPRVYVAFYSQQGDELAELGSPATPYYRPTAITVDDAKNIYVLDAGDSSGANSNNSCTGTVTDPGTSYTGKVRVYDSTGVYKYVFGTRTEANCASSVGGAFKQPSGIVFESGANQIWVVDTLNGRLQIFAAYSVDPLCTYVKSIGASTPTTSTPLVCNTDNCVKFASPVDVAFEYSSFPTLNRIYVAERGRNEIAVVDPANGRDLKLINASSNPTVSMKFPSALLFEKTATGGVLYTNNSATATAADVLPLSIDLGAVPPVPAVTLAITTTILPTTTAFSIDLAGTTSPANAVSCSVNLGSDQPATGTGTWTLNSLPLDPGYNYILCKAVNGAEISYAWASTFVTATPQVGPELSILQPGAGVYTNATTVAVSGTSLAGATIKIDNANASFSTTVTADAAGNWSTVADLDENSNIINVTASKLGYAGSNTSVTVVADYTLPDMTNAVSFLADGATTNNAVQNLDGIVFEKNFSKVEVNGVVAAKVTMTTPNNTYFSAPVVLNRGLNTVTITATDLAGNSSTVTRTVTLNPDAPALAVTAPADNSYMIGVSSTSAAVTLDTSYTGLNAAGSAITPSGGTWNGSISVNGGISPYRFTASGGGNPAVSLKRTIINGSGYVALAISSPSSDIATKNSAILISGSVVAGSAPPTVTVDDGAVGATITGFSYTVGTGDFSFTLNMTKQGNHYVKVSANAATTAIRNIIYDSVSPDMSIQSDSKVMPTVVKGSIEGPAKMIAIDATLNGSAYSIPLSVISYTSYDLATDSVVWTANLNGYSYDKGTLKFTVADPATNQKQLTYTNEVPTGDIDGDGIVRTTDALSALRHVAGTETLTGSPRTQCDVGYLVDGHAAQDGDCDITDAVLILNKAFGLLGF